MESFQKKAFVTRRSLKYTYFVSPPKEYTQKDPVLLFLHGFPDSAQLWSDVIATLLALPNKMIVPDCLGYAGTDKPEDTSLYAYKDQADDLVDILNNEKAVSTIIIGHDWGSVLAQRTYLHNRELFSGVVLVNAAYMIPTDQPFDLTSVNEQTEKTLGYPQYAYWEFFTAPDAPEILDGNLERMWQVLHGDAEHWMRKLFCVPNAMRKFLASTEDMPVRAYAQQSKRKDKFMQQFKAGGFASALQMYKAAASNIQFNSDLAILKKNLAIEVPTLYLSCTKDDVCLPEMMSPAKNRGLVPDLKEVSIVCAHWSPMEKPSEIAAHIKDFLVNRFSYG